MTDYEPDELSTATSDIAWSMKTPSWSVYLVEAFITEVLAQSLNHVYKLVKQINTCLSVRDNKACSHV